MKTPKIYINIKERKAYKKIRDEILKEVLENYQKSKEEGNEDKEHQLKLLLKQYKVLS